jgi:hypothetical protein
MTYSDFSKEQMYYGSEEHRPPEKILLKAGPFVCQYEAGYLRYLRAGRHEIIRMIYPAVRDHNWGTVVPIISGEKLQQADDHFEISYQALYRQGEIHFKADYLLQGTADGTISFEMKGEALSSFRKNRIGFNVLHPPEVAGLPFRLTKSDDEQEEGYFPRLISPHQPMMDMKILSWDVGVGLWAEVSFEGEVFEMEDQRNWTDSSFKTYSTPLHLPFPVKVEKGTKLYQKVSLQLLSEAPSQPPLEEKLVVSVKDKHYALPAIGIGQSSEIAELAEQDINLLGRLNFTHYRVDVRLSDKDLETQWKRAVKESSQLSLSLELALHFSIETGRELGNLKDLLESDRPEIRQLLIFSQEHKCTPDNLLSQVLPDLKSMFPQVPVGAGTDCFFTELNRERVNPQGLDFLSYSLNPQVHQFDNQSLIETLEAQSFTIESSRAFAETRPVHISPISLKMRFNPNATGPEPHTATAELPPQVDSRQMSLFAAGWTLGSIHHLSQQQASSVTYYETLGMRGIMQGEHEPLLPEKFGAFKEMLYPMYWVFYMLLRHQPVRILASESTDQLQVISLVWEYAGQKNMLLANLQPYLQKVEVKAWQDSYDCLFLDEDSFMAFTTDHAFMQNADWKTVQSLVELKPYALALLR